MFFKKGERRKKGNCQPFKSWMWLGWMTICSLTVLSLPLSLPLLPSTPLSVNNRRWFPCVFKDAAENLPIFDLCLPPEGGDMPLTGSLGIYRGKYVHCSYSIWYKVHPSAMIFFFFNADAPELRCQVWQPLTTCDYSNVNLTLMKIK